MSLSTLTRTDAGPALSEAARHVIKPAGIVSTGWPRVRDTCRKLGWTFDRWQDDAGRLILAKRAPEPNDPVAGGLYAADTIVLSIPRQVGKTYLIACIVFALCLIHPGLTVIWTAHRKTTAAETFETFAGMADRPEVKPHIKPGRGGVKRGRGDEKILFRNGSRILFGARENGFGRGFSNVGVIVFDEAQILTEATLEDMGAAQNVAANPLTFMMGTPPRPKDPGEYFATMRQEAIDEEVDDTLYIEFSADRAAAEADPMDPEQIGTANPSYPHRTSHRAMLRLRKKLKSLDSWLREALGVWDEVSVHRAPITESIWRTLDDFGPDLTVAPNALGVDMSHGMDISVGACWLENDGGAHLEEVWAGTDSLAAIDWIAKVAGRRMEVVIDDLSPAAHMIPTLKAKGVNVRRSHSRDMAKGCLLFETYFKGRKLSHADQKSLNDATKGARKRPISDAGGWGWDRRDSTVLIHQLVAVTLALLGALERQRPQRQEGRSGVAL